MVQNNISLPSHIYGYVRNSFCSDVNPDRMMPVVIFGVESVPGLTPLFHVLREDGAIYSQLPLHAFAHREDAPQRQLSELVRWDSFGWNISAVAFDYLMNMDFHVNLPVFAKGRETGFRTERGRYICTLDYFDNGFSNEPCQHKQFHLLALEDGNYALQSNDFCRVEDKSFTKPQAMHLKRQTELWSAE